MKKNLLLTSFILGAMLLVMIGGVSAEECNGCGELYKRPCANVDICEWTTDTQYMDCGLPLGSEDTASCGLSYNTFWAVDTTATATCTFDGDDLEETILYVSINNDIVSCTLNGHEVLSSTIHEGCAPEDPRDGFSANIQSYVEGGENTLVCTVEDRGVMTHFDACVIDEYEPCEVIVLSPNEGEYYDPLWINWTYEGSCDPSTYTLQYKEGNCDSGGYWPTIDTVDSDDVPMSYWWDPNQYSLPSGEYCIRVRMDQGDGPHVSGYSGIWNLDLEPPEVSLSVGDPKVGECLEEEPGDCYVNTQTLITLTCEETTTDLWQSGVDYIEYRINGGPWILYTGPFSFLEDSNHLLEYKCYDKVQKVDEEEKQFIVESVGPTFIKKTIWNPKYFPDGGSYWYVTQDTEICVVYNDLGDHPVGDVEVWCEWDYWENPDKTGYYGYKEPFKLDQTGCFTFDEDSYHELHCWAYDALNNYDCGEDLYETDIVDSQSPITTLDYTGPEYEDFPKWIDTASRVVLTAVDYPLSHPVGVDKIYYRYGIVDDSFCYGTNQDPFEGLSEEWSIYEEPFGFPEQSCHAIEYYSVDFLDNEESINTEFVFVDKTAPTLIKTVGKPNHECTILDKTLGICDSDWDWKVTMETPIELSCVDEDVHSSGVDELCYRIVWDGDEEGSSWVCVPDDKVTIYFSEECEHTLEFYCVDNVEKQSETDSEVFKVEGTSFEIGLDKKWNLISVPFNLLSTDIEEVFEDISGDIEGVWSYKDGAWMFYSPTAGGDLTELVPGRGYWVKTSEETSLLIGGSEMSPGPTLPSSVELDTGWNLIGRYGVIENQPAYCALFSLVDTQQGFPRWSSLWGYSSGSFIPLEGWSWTNPGEGYWIEMDVEDFYSPSSVCYGYPY